MPQRGTTWTSVALSLSGGAGRGWAQGCPEVRGLEGHEGFLLSGLQRQPDTPGAGWYRHTIWHLGLWQDPMRGLLTHQVKAESECNFRKAEKAGAPQTCLAELLEGRCHCSSQALMQLCRGEQLPRKCLLQTTERGHGRAPGWSVATVRPISPPPWCFCPFTHASV